MSISLSADHPLRQKTFCWYFSGRVVSILGTSLVPVALSFAVLQLGGSASTLGLLLAAQAVSQVCFVLVGGVVADRFPRRTVMASANGLMFLTQGTTACLLLAGELPVLLIAVLQVAYGLGQAFFSPADTGIVPELVPGDRVQDAQALLSLSRNTARVAGPIAAGGLVVTIGPGFAILIDALSFLVACVMFATLPSRLHASPAHPQSFLGSLREGWREFSSRTWVWVMVSSFGFYMTLILPAISVIGPVLAYHSSLGPTGWSLVLAAQGVGAVLSGLALLRWRPKNPLTVANGFMVFESLFLLCLAVESPLPMTLAAAALASAGVMAADALWLSTLQREVPQHALSRVSSYDWLGSVALLPLGMASMGFAAEIADLTALLIGIAAANVVVRITLHNVPAIRAVRTA